MSALNECLFHDAPDNRKEYLLFEIVERAYRGKNRVLIFSSDMERAVALDRMLWILRQESFIRTGFLSPARKLRKRMRKFP